MDHHQHVNNEKTTNTSAALFRITGRVKQERHYSLEQLLTMDMVEVKDLLLACGSGEPKGRLKNCVGVLLTDIINSAEVITTGHNDTKRMYVIVSSDDGYTTVFSWQELFNTVVGEGVMVLLEKEGKKLYQEHGGVDLFSARDNLTGPRYVKRLTAIDIIMIE